MDKHTFGLNDSEMYLNYGIYCLVAMAVCFLLPFILKLVGVKSPDVVVLVLRVASAIAFVGVIVCAVMFTIEKLR